MIRTISKVLLLSTATISLSGCFITPDIIQNSEHHARAQYDMQALYKATPDLEAPLSVSEAISRGLLYNFDFKMTMMEEVLQNNQLTLANFNLLPRMAANAGYGWRNSERATTSISLRTRNESLAPSFSEERVVTNADLNMSWNLLDFGLGYFQAKQQADRVLAAVERRRRVMNNMVKEIQTAYWKALSAQELLPQVEELIASTDGALEDSRRIEKQKLQAPLKSLEYRRTLLQVMAQLKQLRSDLSISKAQLRTLVGLHPGQKFELVKPDGAMTTLPDIPKDLNILQDYSLIYRPELREETYQERIDRQNVKKEILRLFPGLSLLASTNYDSNRFLAFQNWQELGARATWNLINVLQGPQAIKTAKAQVEISKMRRMALSAAVLSQVSVSYNQYIQAVEGYSTANELSEIESRVSKISRDSRSARSGSRLGRIQSSAQSLAARLERDNAFASAQAAYANLLVSIGSDIIPSGHNAQTLEEMMPIVEQSISSMMNRDLEQGLKDQHKRDTATEAEYIAPEMPPKPQKKPTPENIVKEATKKVIAKDVSEEAVKEVENNIIRVNS